MPLRRRGSRPGATPCSPNSACPRSTNSTPAVSGRWPRPSATNSRPPPGNGFRPTRMPSSRPPSRPSSAHGQARGRRATASSMAFPKISGPLPPSRPWCSAIWVRPPARASASPAIRRTAATCSMSTTSRTPKARTWSRGAAGPWTSPSWNDARRRPSGRWSKRDRSSNRSSATWRISSSRSRRAGCSCCNREPANERRSPRYGSPMTSPRRGSFPRARRSRGSTRSNSMASRTSD